MRTVGLVLGVLALAAPGWADDFYRWTDANGNVHYSNTPTATGKSATVESRASDDTDPAEPAAAEPVAAAATEGAGKAPAADDDSFSASASLRRNALERDLRATEKKMRELDARLAGLARARGKHAHGSEATGGVGTAALDVRSEEEKAIAGEREQLAQHAVEVRNEAAGLRKEVTARFGETPAWWVDVR